MMDEKETRTKYDALIADVLSKDFYTQINLDKQINCYVCSECKKVTKTRDIDPGVTPFMSSCSHCGEMARSTFYRDVRPLLAPTHEWCRPTLSETLKMDPANLEHVLAGGLLCREILDEELPF